MRYKNVIRLFVCFIRVPCCYLSLFLAVSAYLYSTPGYAAMQP